MIHLEVQPLLIKGGVLCTDLSGPGEFIINFFGDIF